MPGVNTLEEFVPIDGVVATGVFGTAVAPTTYNSTLGVTWTDLGLVTAAGTTRSTAATATVRRAWQNNKKLRTLVSEASVRFNFILVQTNKATVELFHGTTVDANGKLIVNPGASKPLIAFNLDMIDGTGVVREYVPEAQVVEVGDQIALPGDGLGWPITIESSYNAGIAGHTIRWFSSLASAAVPVITTALPASQGAGQIVKLVGTGFSVATAVTVGGTAATEFDAPNDTELYVTLPAGSAGSAPIIVTSLAGPSTAKAYTRVV